MYITRIDLLLNPKEERLPSDLGALLNVIFSAAELDLVDITSSLRAHLTSLRAEINATINISSDQMTKIHLKDMIRRIDNAVDPKK